MNTNLNNKEIEILIEKYDEGATSSKEEELLFAYFSTQSVSEDLQNEQSYFCSLNELKSKQTRSLSDEKAVPSFKKRYSLSYFVRLTAVAASVALVVVGSGLYFQLKPKGYTLIDGKKYTDKETMEQVFVASVQNVKLNTQDMFKDLDNIMP